MVVARRRHSERPLLLGLAALLGLAGLSVLGGGPARAQWGDSYQQPGGGTYY